MTPQNPIQPIKTATGQHYGAIATVDARDHALAAYTPLAAAGAPVIESYYPNLTGIPFWMQNQLGACVGHAAGKAKQIASFHESGAVKITPYSARFLYAMAKCLDGMPNVQGTDPRIVAKIMQKYGVATEATCANDTLLDHSTYTYGGKLANIPVAAINEAASNGSKISNYAFADITVQGLKAAIQFAGENKGGVFMLTNIDKHWWTAPNGNSSWAKSDISPLHTPTDAATLGGHETVPVAFDTIGGRAQWVDFNSWSSAWCSTTGQGTDGGSAMADMQSWLPYIEQIIVFFDIPSDYTALGFTYTFSKMLKQGQSGSDIVALQHALKIDGVFPQTTALTGYFGATTLAAVNAFQVKYAADILYPQGLSQPTGIVGSGMIAKLNSLFSPKTA